MDSHGSFWSLECQLEGIEQGMVIQRIILLVRVNDVMTWNTPCAKVCNQKFPLGDQPGVWLCCSGGCIETTLVMSMFFWRICSMRCCSLTDVSKIG